MKKPTSVSSLEKLGMVRLSKSFYMRDFIYSDTAMIHKLNNIPDDPDLAIEVGTRLYEELLEPLNSTFGRVAVRSSYRSCVVNDFCNKHNQGCAKNESNYARHIWDKRDADGFKGAMACIVLPWFADKYEQGADWRALAHWIHDHLPYSELEFFPDACAFNISWHENPKRYISSFIKPAGVLLKGEQGKSGYEALYKDFPSLKL